MAGNTGGPWGGGGNSGGNNGGSNGGGNRGDNGNNGGGRKPGNDGPQIPEIDELVKKGQEQLRVLMGGRGGTGGGNGSKAPVGQMMMVSLISALVIAVGKIAISLLSAFAIVYFRFPFKMFCFWAIFLTLMLPIWMKHNT